MNDEGKGLGVPNEDKKRSMMELECQRLNPTGGQ
jgi:hypothetical protein